MFNNQSIGATSQVVIQVVIIGLVVGKLIHFEYRRKHRGINTSGASVLLSYYTEGAELMKVASGTMGDMPYTSIATTDAKVLLYRVELPFTTGVHLLGIPTREGVTQLNPAASKNLMELVDLEGDYGKYFSLYAEKDQQTQSRYVLDPKGMVFTIDFCQSHNWEIIKNELYFVQTGANAEDDPTHMSDDIVQFVTEIRPAVQIAPTAQEAKNAMSYGDDRRTNLKCPVCQESMKNSGNYFTCTQGDGVLLTGKHLVELKNGTMLLDVASTVAGNKDRGPLTCPSCNSTMEHLAYNGGSQTIDTCPSCPYRWLDAAEVGKINAIRSSKNVTS